MKITKVARNSLAKELGLEKGDEIIAFDGYPCESELDYQYYCGQSHFTMTVRNVRSGETQELTVEKDETEDLGLTFEKNENIRTCHNRCVFCFVDQMPKGMRESLYVKDDDYKMSFTCGNFVTLTNVSDEQIERIIRLRLSPLYVSVHTMNPALRVELLRNRFAGKIVEQIKRLAENGIEIHCQAVVVPNKNDGEELAYTARELFKYYPTVRDLACVPTGLTKHREGLTQISDVDKQYCEKILDLVDSLNAEFGVNFIVPADEYFVRAEREVKPTEFYGDFSQIENGVGMTREFVEQAEEILNQTKAKTLKKPKKVLLISGVSAKKINEGLAKKVMQKAQGLTVEVLAVENEFFGKTVTCTGLLTGQDIASAVLKYLEINEKPDEIILPSNTMKEFEEVFLCGMTLKELKKRVGCKITVNSGGGSTLVGELMK
jgi:putative radical SAM enzyme (TIGR03279 family)